VTVCDVLPEPADAVPAGEAESNGGLHNIAIRNQYIVTHTIWLMHMDKKVQIREL
jgi:hypothetical protein